MNGRNEYRKETIKKENRIKGYILIDIIISIIIINIVLKMSHIQLREIQINRQISEKQHKEFIDAINEIQESFVEEVTSSNLNEIELCERNLNLIYVCTQ